MSQLSMITEEAPPRVVLVYRNELVRDVLVQVLQDRGIAEIVTVPENLVALSAVQDIDPDVIVFDDAETDSFRRLSQSILFCSTPLRLKKLIALGSGFLITLSCQKDVVADANMGDLIEQARYIPIPVNRSSIVVDQLQVAAERATLLRQTAELSL